MMTNNNNEEIKTGFLKNNDGKTVLSENYKYVNDCIGKDLSPMEKEQLINGIKGMSKEEMFVVLESIPFNIVLDHIRNEFEKNKRFADSIRKSIDILE